MGAAQCFRLHEAFKLYTCAVSPVSRMRHCFLSVYAPEPDIRAKGIREEDAFLGEFLWLLAVGLTETLLQGLVRRDSCGPK